MVFLTTTPIWIAAVLLLGLGTVVSMAGTVFVRRCVSLERLRANNEVAGFKFAVVGVLYAVLLAFAVLVVWEKFNEAESEVAFEAGAVVTVFRLAEGIEPPAGPALHDAVAAYVEAAIAEDWPAMGRGQESEAALDALGGIYAALLGHRPADVRGAVVLAECLRQLDLITQARRARLVVASGIVPGVVWAILFTAAFVTIGFTFFFGTENLRAQVLMTGALAFLIFAGLLVIVAIDRPFAGTVKVEPEPLERALEDFGGAAQLRQ